MPENRSDFIQAFRDQAHFTASAASTHVASAAQLSRYLDDALALYSRCRPVEGLTATLSTTSGSQDVPLPVDWLKDNEKNNEILRSIEAGIDPRIPRVNRSSLDFKQGYPGYRYGYSGGMKFNGISDNLSQPLTPPAPALGKPQVIRKFVEGVMLPVFVMRYEAAASFDYPTRYYGRHRVEDGDPETEESPGFDAICTVPAEDEETIFELMLAASLNGLIHQYSLEGKPIRDLIEQARELKTRVLARITPPGINI